jgi:conjugative relaxase-like TrwC/TraI family protein
VLSIGKLVAGAEDYYLRTVAGGREEYYIGAGEAPGLWVGDGTALLGLTGTVGASQLRVLLAAFSPEGERLGSRPIGRSRVAGFDLTFSAPKSVSLLWGLSERGVSDAVRAAHDEAVVDAFGYLERHATKARRGAGGEMRIAANGLVGAAFRHRTSRTGDPQLHSHVLVANAVLAEDGRWSAPDARLLYFHARTAGFLYQASLRTRLAGSLGVSFGPVQNGYAEIEGVDEQMIRAFSSRREAIADALERKGFSSRRAAEVAALATRPSKSPAPDQMTGATSLHDRWRQSAMEWGFEPGELMRVLGQPRLTEIGAYLDDSFRVNLLGAGGLTSRFSTFERRDVVRAAAEHLVDGGTVASIEGVADSILLRPDAVRLGLEGRGGEPLHTTTELLAIEERLLHADTRRRARGVAAVECELVEGVLAEHPDLSAEQAGLVRRLTGSGDGLEAVVGRAGTGKTYALEAAREAWQRAGFDVYGVALAARAAAELEGETGTPSETYAALVARLQRGERVLSERSVLVADEAGMLGTRALARLADLAREADAKVVFVGDHRQLPEIEAGGAFAALARDSHGATLSTNRRQDARWERVALDELRSGDVANALKAYDQMGRLHLEAKALDAAKALVADWIEVHRTESATMLAVSRVEVDGLNTEARAELRHRGLLGPDVVTAGGRSFAFGDEVMCLRNDRALRVRNGTRGKLLGISGPMVTIATGDGDRRLPLRYLEEGWLTHSYATTIHKAQGATFKRAFVLATDTLYREAGYVALSRARIRTDLYLVEGAFDLGREFDEGPDRLEGIRRALSESRAKRLASSFDPSDTGVQPTGLERRIERTGPGLER